MAASGTYTFNPEFADLVDEALERCEIDPADIGGRHIRSIARSAELMFADWTNRGATQWKMVKYSLTLVQGTASYALPSGAFDVFHATFKTSDAKEREMYPISRSDYNALHDKTIQGQTDRFFVDRSTFIGADPASTVYLWQVPNAAAATGTMEMWYIRRGQDIGQATSGATLDLPYHWTEAFTAGLAYNISRKFAKQHTEELLKDYLGEDKGRRDSHMPGGALGRAMDGDREQAPATFRVRFDRRSGRRG